MAKKQTAPRIDLGAELRGMVAQFRDLDPKEPGQWPLLPKAAAWAAAALAVVVLGWPALLSNASDRKSTRLNSSH